MEVIRLFLLVAVLGGLTLLLAQNWSPALPLVFLGIRTQAIPLAMWILFSTTAGAFTSLFISSLFRFSTYFARQQRSRLKSPATSPRRNQTRREEPSSRPASPPPTPTASDRSADVADDWETNSSADDDWDFEEKPKETTTPNRENTQIKDETSYEPQEDRQTNPQSDSVYSYSYRQPKNAVGRTESIYDADYRVIIPPYQAPDTNQKNDDDDWGFFEDDDSVDDKPRK